MSLEGAPGRLYDGLKDAKMTVAVTAGNLLVSSLAPPEFSVEANYRLGEQAARAIPSAFVTPPVSGMSPEVALLGVEVLPITVSFELARRTVNKLELSKWGLLGTALLAQTLSSAADAGVERIGFLDKEQLARPDNGSSGVLSGFVAKAWLDRSADARDRGEIGKSRKYLGGLGGFGLLMTAGAYFTDNIDGNLSVIAHGAGIGAGALAHLGSRLLKRRKAKREANQANGVNEGGKQVTIKEINARQQLRLEAVRRDLAVLASISANFDAELRRYG